MDKTLEMFKTICEIPGLSNLSEEMKEYARALEESQQEVLSLFEENEATKWADIISFDELTRLSFSKAHTIIKNISFKKRLKLLSQLDYHLVCLYEETKKYKDLIAGKSELTPKDFMRIMAKIKHLEILQSWLYGIE